jgi:DNA segregation ATPase FtsK/SpoIIIE-like protein
MPRYRQAGEAAEMLNRVLEDRKKTFSEIGVENIKLSWNLQGRKFPL